MRSSTIRRSSFAVAAAAALALTGCSNGGGSTDAGSSVSVDSEQSSASATDQGEQGQESSPSQTATGGESQGQTEPDADLRDVEFSVSPQQALDISAEEIGSDGTVHAIEIDYSEHNQAWTWSVKTLVSGTDHEVEINADTGKILETEKESTNDTEKPISLTDPMPLQEAQKLALQKVEGPIRGWKLEWDDGIKAYQFDIGDGQGDEVEVTVNVEDGSVTVDD